MMPVKLKFCAALILAVPVACTTGIKSPMHENVPEPVSMEHLQTLNRVDVTIGGSLFTSYLYADTFEKPFLFPVMTASGITVTRGYPIAPREGETVDHPHQTGYWFNYGNVNGIDYWGNSKWLTPEERKKYGVVRFRKIESIAGMDDRGILAVSHDWIEPDGSVPVTENVTYEFRGGKDYRIIDHNTTLTALVDVAFSDTKEGAFAIRVARFLGFPSSEPRIFVDASGKATLVPGLTNEGVNGNYLSSEGISGAGVWGTRARWMMLYGVHANDTVSLVFMDHPSNVNYPTYWHARDYGLFSANPFGVKDFTQGKEELDFRLKKGEKVTFRHRLLIQSGHSLNTDAVEQAWKDFTRR